MKYIKSEPVHENGRKQNFFAKTEGNQWIERTNVTPSGVMTKGFLLRRKEVEIKTIRTKIEKKKTPESEINYN
mgnify:CR=1 FL=1